MHCEFNRKEGFWRYHDGDSRGFPYPEEGKYTDDERRIEFLDRLYLIERCSTPISYRGSSMCRICGCQNGWKEFHVAGWRWPCGFTHYVKDHLVKPSDDFIRFVMTDVKVDYINYRGERSVRTVIPLQMYFGLTEFHPEPQWLIEGVDVDKIAKRVYALRDSNFRDIHADVAQR